MPDYESVIHNTLSEFLNGKGAHASVQEAVKDFPPSLFVKKPKGTPHTAWQLLEHMRMTLDDLLEFCTNPNYRERKWPEDYWPKNDGPKSAEEWDKSVKALHANLKKFEKLLHAPGVDLYARIPWGNGQTIFREILLAGDHTSYHTGQMILLRKQLGAWKG